MLDVIDSDSEWWDTDDECVDDPDHRPVARPSPNTPMGVPHTSDRTPVQSSAWTGVMRSQVVAERDTDTCCVCLLEPVSETVFCYRGCGHRFHRVCVLGVVVCPLCRSNGHWKRASAVAVAEARTGLVRPGVHTLARNFI
jgi:hypothetical protein